MTICRWRFSIAFILLLPDLILAANFTNNTSTTYNNSDTRDYLKTMIAVVELSKFVPATQNADKIFERVFLMSFNSSTGTRKSSQVPLAVVSTNTTNDSSSSSTSNDTNTKNVTITASNTRVKIHGDLRTILESRRFRISRNKSRYLQKHCGFSWDSINKIAVKTVNQFDDPDYLTLRKYRLTASSFGIILQAIRRNSYPPSLFKKLLGDYNLEKIKAVRWGKFHESSALESLKRMYPSWKIRRAGLYLHKSGLLAASPDAITDDCVIEIKCPYRFRGEKNLDESLLPESKYIIIRANDGTYHVNPSHVYYDQLQAQILFSSRQYGLLYIWTPNEAKLFKIEKDESWTKNVDLILDFYINTYIPHVLDLHKNTGNETGVKNVKTFDRVRNQHNVKA